MKKSAVITDELGPQHLHAEIILLVVTVFWGTSFTYVKLALRDISVFQVIAYRFTLSLVLLFCWRLSALRGIRRQDLLQAFVLGLCLFVAYFAQTLGLKYTTASKSAFITALMVVFVPIFYFLIAGRIPRTASFFGIGLALIGLYLLTRPGEGPLNRGDIYTLACAIIFSLYIVLLQLFSATARLDTLLLGQFLVMAVLGWIATGWETKQNTTLDWQLISIVVYLSVMCTFLATLLMNRFQKDTTATRAAIIYSAEPVFAALFAYVIIHEAMSPVQILGGAAILAGILVAEIF